MHHRCRTYNAEQHLKSTIIEYINEKSNNNQDSQSFYVYVINITLYLFKIIPLTQWTFHHLLSIINIRNYEFL